MPQADDASLTRMISDFLASREAVEVEDLADALSQSGRSEAIAPLVYRLGDAVVQEDRDVEDAVCGALVQLGVMDKLGNLTFRFAAAERMSAEGRSALERHRPLVPQKYMQ